MQNYNNAIIKEFRANSGKVGGGHEGVLMLLLTTIGAKTGRRHTSPLAYSRDGDRFVIVASKGGADTNPSWYFNLIANPVVTVEVGAEMFEAKSAVADRPERDRLFAAHADRMPTFWEYEKNTSRVIPVVTLERVD